MAFRTQSCWRSLYRSFTTSTGSKTKSYGPVVDSGETHRAKKKGLKGDFVPVYVVLGMIGVSVSLGLYTATHQLKHSPNVLVSKKKREMLPELEDPDHVVEEADKFLDKSLFRKVAHIQDSDRVQVTPDPIRGDTYSRPRKVETLKTIGAEASHR
ncbi:uncharacterized protein LOC122071771 [Macadamia integrifolia]|uniref:uncharacterized protein LOC122071771 n=1 Tax=Macadamia integrifolia TaxID=60698 RepID=UPI001C4EE3AC|nr:uncharacterized protein LOC122071771 [Macadamia integrifolia]